jgi:hypothetical protein
MDIGTRAARTRKLRPSAVRRGPDSQTIRSTGGIFRRAAIRPRQPFFTERSSDVDFFIFKTGVLTLMFVCFLAQVPVLICTTFPLSVSWPEWSRRKSLKSPHIHPRHPSSYRTVHDLNLYYGGKLTIGQVKFILIYLSISEKYKMGVSCSEFKVSSCIDLPIFTEQTLQQTLNP